MPEIWFTKLFIVSFPEAQAAKQEHVVSKAKECETRNKERWVFYKIAGLEEVLFYCTLNLWNYCYVESPSSKSWKCVKYWPTIWRILNLTFCPSRSSCIFLCSSSSKIRSPSKSYLANTASISASAWPRLQDQTHKIYVHTSVTVKLLHRNFAKYLNFL